MARVAVTISLSDDERAELEALSRRRKTSQGLARRARMSWRRRKGWRTRRSSRGERGHRGQVASSAEPTSSNRQMTHPAERTTDPSNGSVNRSPTSSCRAIRGEGPRHRMDRNRLQPGRPRQATRINPILAAAGYNFRLILKWIRLLLSLLLGIASSPNYQTHSRKITA